MFTDSFDNNFFVEWNYHEECSHEWKNIEFSILANGKYITKKKYCVHCNYVIEFGRWSDTLPKIVYGLPKPFLPIIPKNNHKFY